MGELPIATQARLLRVLETGEYIRVGGQEVRKTNVRIVAATNVNMRKAVSEGRFREDLYYRLNTIPIMMPPLREGNDILLLFRLFAMQMAEKYKLPKIVLTDDAKAIMLKYKWPGNVRQLKNITEQMSVLSEEREIDAQTLLRFIPQDEETTQLATIAPGQGGAHSYESERELLYKILYELRGNVSDLRRDMNSLRKQLDEARQLNGAKGFAEPQPLTPITPISYPAPVEKESEALHHPFTEDAEVEEIHEAETLNLNDWASRWWRKHWNATTATERKLPKNWEYPTELCIDASRHTSSATTTRLRTTMTTM